MRTIAIFTLISSIAAGVWTYENGDPRSHWGTKCKAGKTQSPINFQDKSMREVTPLQPKWKNKLEGEFINNGHTIQVNAKGQDFKLVDPEGTEYTLLQFHIHVPSEHHRYSKAFDAEVHFVHKSDKDEYAVFGVWFRVAKKSNGFVRSLLSNGVPKKGETLPVNVNFKWLRTHLKRSRKYWSYTGSLTTPPCTENIRWTVPDVAFPISVEHYQLIHAAMPFNARPTQAQPVEGEGGESVKTADKEEGEEETEKPTEKGQKGKDEGTFIEYDEDGYLVPTTEYQDYDFHDYYEDGQ
jgi:carbonic anhydrase